MCCRDMFLYLTVWWAATYDVLPRHVPVPDCMVSCHIWCTAETCSCTDCTVSCHIWCAAETCSCTDCMVSCHIWCTAETCSCTNCTVSCRIWCAAETCSCTNCVVSCHIWCAAGTCSCTWLYGELPHMMCCRNMHVPVPDCTVSWESWSHQHLCWRRNGHLGCTAGWHSCSDAPTQTSSSWRRTLISGSIIRGRWLK